MPERLFKYLETAELIRYAKSITEAVLNGSVTGLRNSNTGFLVETSALPPTMVQQRLMGIRYELYLRGKSGDAAALAKEPTDPRRERVMQVTQVFC